MSNRELGQLSSIMDYLPWLIAIGGGVFLISQTNIFGGGNEGSKAEEFERKAEELSTEASRYKTAAQKMKELKEAKEKVKQIEEEARST